MKSMTARERFHAIMNFKPFDRLPVLEWAPWWDQTISRWHKEGLPPEITDRYDINRYFGQEPYIQDWISPRKPTCPAAPHHGASIIKTMDDYIKVKEHLYPLPAINAEWWKKQAELQHKGEAVLWFTLDGFFWFPRTLMGIQEHMTGFYDQPELMHRINSDNAEWQMKVIGSIFDICVPDFMTFAEDMSYNHGPMLSKKCFDEFMKPNYAKVIPVLKERDVTVFIDSDGDITKAAPWFTGCGIDGILPLERQAGVDLGKLRVTHPKLRFLGGYDKMVMNKGEEEIRAEFERLMPVAKQGGYILGVDHQTPPGVSLENYRIFLKLFRECGKMS
jgi:hypothetical protein